MYGGHYTAVANCEHIRLSVDSLSSASLPLASSSTPPRVSPSPSVAAAESSTTDNDDRLNTAAAAATATSAMAPLSLQEYIYPGNPASTAAAVAAGVAAPRKRWLKFDDEFVMEVPNQHHQPQQQQTQRQQALMAGGGPSVETSIVTGACCCSFCHSLVRGTDELLVPLFIRVRVSALLPEEGPLPPDAAPLPVSPRRGTAASSDTVTDQQWGLLFLTAVDIVHTSHLHPCPAASRACLWDIYRAADCCFL